MNEQMAIPEVPVGQVAEQQVKPKKPRKKKEVDPSAPPTQPMYRDSSKFPLSAKIHLISQENPKLVGSKAAADWEKYREGMTVKEAREAGISLADIHYNAQHQFLQIEGYDAPPPRKRPAKVKGDVAVDPQPPAPPA